MSKNTKRALLGVAGLVAILVCLGLWIGLSPNTRVPTGNQLTSQPNGGYEAGGPNCRAEYLATVTPAEKRESEAQECADAQEQHRREQSDLVQQTRAANAGAIVAWFTYDQTRIALAQAILSFLGVIATAWAAWAAVIAARAAQAAVSVAQSASEKQLRAYLTVEPGLADYDAAAGRITVRPIIKNAGQTPAYRATYHANATLLTLAQAASFDFRVPKTEVISASTIGSGGDAHMTIEPSEALGAAQVNEVTNPGGRLLFVYGQVYYTDVFGKAWETEFCRFLHWSHNDEGKITHWLNWFNRHNDAT